MREGWSEMIRPPDSELAHVPSLEFTLGITPSGAACASPVSAGMVGAMTARTIGDMNQGVATYIRHAQGWRDLEGPLARLVDRLPDRADREAIYDLRARCAGFGLALKWLTYEVVDIEGRMEGIAAWCDDQARLQRDDERGQDAAAAYRGAAGKIRQALKARPLP